MNNMKKECNSPFSDTIGMSGKMGKVIALFRLYRDTGEEDWETEAEKLLEATMKECSLASPLSYGNGLCGMGVGIEYLIQNHFIEGDSDEILSELDNQIIYAINSRPALDLDLQSGILGLACYMYSRLHYRKSSEEPIVLILKEQAIYLIDWIADAMQDNSINKDYYEVYFILVLLHQLNILNAKIENMMEWCDKIILTLKS